MIELNEEWDDDPAKPERKARAEKAEKLARDWVAAVRNHVQARK